MRSPFIGSLKKNILLNTTLVRCVDALTLLLIFTIAFPLVVVVVFLSQLILWLYAAYITSKSITILVGRKLNIIY